MRHGLLALDLAKAFSIEALEGDDLDRIQQRGGIGRSSGFRMRLSTFLFDSSPAFTDYLPLTRQLHTSSTGVD